METKNESGLKAVGRAVLCKPYDPELSQTMIAIPDHVKAMQLMAEMRVTVLQLGEACWPDEPPRAQAGDRVLVSKFTGVIVKGPLDGEIYRLVNDNDVFCQITGDAWDKMLIEDPIKKTKQVERTTSVGRMVVPTR